jgi:hypothetical protein
MGCGRVQDPFSGFLVSIPWRHRALQHSCKQTERVSDSTPVVVFFFQGFQLGMQPGLTQSCGSQATGRTEVPLSSPGTKCAKHLSLSSQVLGSIPGRHQGSTNSTHSLPCSMHVGDYWWLRSLRDRFEGITLHLWPIQVM